ncbi:MAG: hypothetical protein H8E42_03580 [Nitrospinae bacterium]|nr:hypothetical protein [Nitrospinota bacterium]MBL7020366.1 hypothetical protein [Nitrospinaceae bacterium]
MKYIRAVVVMLVMVTGCGNGVDGGEDVVEKSSFQMPVKENTWVRKETVRKTKSDMFSSTDKAVSVDPALAAKLKKSAVLPIKTQQECSDQANALDKRRIEVQERGGVWHAYERDVKAKPYSNYGMQLDSQTNRLVFSLKHICQNAQEVRLGGWGTQTVQRFESMGKEGYTNYFINLGEVPGDIDRWVRFAEFAIQGRDRNIPYSEIGESLGQAKGLIALYDDLSQRKITDDATLQTFLSEGATLLSVINESFASDPRLVLALQYEKLFPFEDIEGEM